MFFKYSKNQIIFGVGLTFLSFGALSYHQHLEYKKPQNINFVDNLRRRFSRPEASIFQKAQNLFEQNKLMHSILLLNGLVFAGWQVPAFQFFMKSHFIHSFYSRPYTLLTSTFSHSSFLHFAFNMMAFQSFFPAIQQRLGDDQTLAFYLSTGALSGVFSHIYHLRFGTSFAALGASGAIWALFALFVFC